MKQMRKNYHHIRAAEDVIGSDLEFLGSLLIFVKLSLLRDQCCFVFVVGETNEVCSALHLSALLFLFLWLFLFSQIR